MMKSKIVGFSVLLNHRAGEEQFRAEHARILENFPWLTQRTFSPTGCDALVTVWGFGDLESSMYSEPEKGCLWIASTVFSDQLDWPRFARDVSRARSATDVVVPWEGIGNLVSV